MTNDAPLVKHPASVNYEWFGITEDGLRLIVRRRESDELSQISVTVFKEKNT